MDRASLQAWIALGSVPALSGASFRRLLAAYGTPEQVLDRPLGELTRLLDARTAEAIRANPGSAAVQAALDWSDQPGRAIITLADAHYPALLRETPDPPPVVYAMGCLDLLVRPGLAIVGSRNASAQGMRNAEAFARNLSAHGLCIVSGMALGIDAAAHRGALDAAGRSIAVLGCGIDIVYPKRNEALLRALATRGLVLSEFPLQTPPLAQNFPRRNRIIAGLSRGCLVVEAALASGSLVTARAAADMGREVFAIPGSIHSPLSKGCHHLIKQGAKLVEEAADVLEELGIPVRRTEARKKPAALEPEAERVLAALGHDPCDFDTLVERTALPVDRLAALLGQLEIEARVQRDHAGLYQRLDD